MSQDRFTRRAIDRISENRIQTAIEEGQFDNLPGFGKPPAPGGARIAVRGESETGGAR